MADLKPIGGGHRSPKIPVRLPQETGPILDIGERPSYGLPRSIKDCRLPCGCTEAEFAAASKPVNGQVEAAYGCDFAFVYYFTFNLKTKPPKTQKKQPALVIQNGQLVAADQPQTTINQLEDY
jgi:hypothetical protein